MASIPFPSYSPAGNEFSGTNLPLPNTPWPTATTNPALSATEPPQTTGWAPVNMSRGYNLDANGDPSITYTPQVIDYYNSILTKPNDYKFSLGATPTSKPILTYSGQDDIPMGYNGSGSWVTRPGGVMPTASDRFQGFPQSMPGQQQNFITSMFNQPQQPQTSQNNLLPSLLRMIMGNGQASSGWGQSSGLSGVANLLRMLSALRAPAAQMPIPQQQLPAMPNLSMLYPNYF